MGSPRRLPHVNRDDDKQQTGCDDDAPDAQAWAISSSVKNFFLRAENADGFIADGIGLQAVAGKGVGSRCSGRNVKGKFNHGRAVRHSAISATIPRCHA